MTEERSYLRRPGESLVVSGGAVIEVTAIDADNGEVQIAVTSKGPVYEGELLRPPPSSRGYRTAPGSSPGQAPERKGQR